MAKRKKSKPNAGKKGAALKKGDAQSKKRPAGGKAYKVHYGMSQVCLTGGTDVLITVSGTAVNLEGFPAAPDGWSLKFAAPPAGGVELIPIDSSGSGADPVTMNGFDWSCEYDETCDDVDAHEVTIVVWFRYTSNVDVHWLVEQFTVTIPPCGQIPAC